MDDEHADPLSESRPPTISDLIKICRELNKNNVKYVIVGGMAMIQAGYLRATEDIDLLLDSSTENIERVKLSLAFLPENAIKEVLPSDIDEYVVVRVVDEIVIDLMKSACGITFNEAQQFINVQMIDGVKIPVASPEILWKMKQTLREKDTLDLLFLKELLNKEIK